MNVFSCLSRFYTNTSEEGRVLGPIDERECDWHPHEKRHLVRACSVFDGLPMRTNSGSQQCRIWEQTGEIEADFIG